MHFCALASSPLATASPRSSICCVYVFFSSQFLHENRDYRTGSVNIFHTHAHTHKNTHTESHSSDRLCSLARSLILFSHTSLPINNSTQIVVSLMSEHTNTCWLSPLIFELENIIINMLWGYYHFLFVDSAPCSADPCRVCCECEPMCLLQTSLLCMSRVVP